MQSWVYVLSALTSTACVILLARGYRRTGVKLLFWSALCFAGLAVQNTLLHLDVVVFPEANFQVWRNLLTGGSLAILLYGLIWETD